MRDTDSKLVRIIGVPMDLGQDRRGTDMGPSALRYAGLKARLKRLGLEVQDSGNISVPIAEEIEGQEPQSNGQVSHLSAAVTACEVLYQEVIQKRSEGEVAIFLGGDHSLSLGSVGAMAAAQEPLGVLWVDAHGDYNTPRTSPSGNLHGMVLAALTGLGPPELVNIGHAGRKIDPANVAVIGLRDLDRQESVALSESGAALFTMHDLDARGIARVAQEALERLSGVARLHVSLDMDCLDPEIAPGVGTPVDGGLTYREAHLLMELVATTGKVRSVDVVEINPVLDYMNRTAELAVELVASLLGKTIL